MILILLLALILPATAAKVPPTPTEWRIGQQVHVRINGLNPEDKAEAIDYLKSLIEPLELDHSYVFDDNLSRQPYGSEGISITYLDLTGNKCYETKTVTGYEEDSNGNYINPYVIQSIRIGKDCYGGNRINKGENWDNYWHNVLAHEFFCHANLFKPNDSGHLTFIGRMPLPLCFHSTTNDYLVWTENDQWQLKRKYSRDRLLNLTRMKFKKKQIGKTCYLIRGRHSVSFDIKQEYELLPYLDNLKKYKRKIKG